MSPVLQLMVETIRGRKAGRNVQATKDIFFPFNDLLRDAGCLQGTSRYEAIQNLEALEKAKVLILERHARDLSSILKVRIPLDSLRDFFSQVGEVSPHEERESLASIFEEAAGFETKMLFEERWRAFCFRLVDAAKNGDSVAPFERGNLIGTRKVLQTLPRLLAWEGESLIRFASSLLQGDSKFLEASRGRIEKALAQISNGEIRSLSQLGILENERSFLIHGPLVLSFCDKNLELAVFAAPVRIGASDIARALLVPGSKRCVTVENAAMLYELAKLDAGIILASSGSEGGFANSAVVSFLQKLPEQTELFHFGDSDPKGFDILRDLRERSGRKIASLHMNYRIRNISDPLSAEDRKLIERLLESEYLGLEEKSELRAMLTTGRKGSFEQESLGLPKQRWPFY